MAVGRYPTQPNPLAGKGGKAIDRPRMQPVPLPVGEFQPSARLKHQIE